jgi:hypothetical protein
VVSLIDNIAALFVPLIGIDHLWLDDQDLPMITAVLGNSRDNNELCEPGCSAELGDGTACRSAGNIY